MLPYVVKQILLLLDRKHGHRAAQNTDGMTRRTHFVHFVGKYFKGDVGGWGEGGWGEGGGGLGGGGGGWGLATSVYQPITIDFNVVGL